MVDDKERVEVSDAPDEHRFQVRVGGELAGFAAYRLAEDRLVFTHTEIDDRFEGQGLGSQLAQRALDQMRDSGRRVVLECPFMASYVERHPEYADLIEPRSA